MKMNLRSFASLLLGRRQAPAATTQSHEATPPKAATLDGMIGTTVALLSAQGFKRSNSNEAAHALMATMIMSGGTEFGMGGGMDFVKPRESSEGFHLVGLAYSEDGKNADNHYVIQSILEGDATDAPRILKLKDFVSQIGNNDIVEFFEKLPRSENGVGLRTIASSKAVPA